MQNNGEENYSSHTQLRSYCNISFLYWTTPKHSFTNVHTTALKKLENRKIYTYDVG